MIFGEHIGIQVTAAEALTSHLGFAMALSDGKVANNGAEASGIIMSKGAIGEAINIGTVGDLPYQAGGAVTKGNKLTVGTSGYFTAAGSGDFIVGRSITTVTSGSVGRGMFNFNNPQYAFSSSFATT